MRGAVLFGTACWVVGLLLPWLVNGLYDVPGVFWGGADDPSYLWPYASGGSEAVLVQLAAAGALMLTPVTSVIGALEGSAVLVADRRILAPDTRRLLVVLVAVATTAAVYSPFGEHLVTWILD